MVQTSDHIFICIYAYTCTFNWTSHVLNNAHYKFSPCFTHHKSDTQHVFSLIQSHTTSSNTLRFNRPTIWLHSCLALSQTKIVQNQFVYVNCSPDFTIWNISLLLVKGPHEVEIFLALLGCSFSGTKLDLCWGSSGFFAFCVQSWNT